MKDYAEVNRAAEGEVRLDLGIEVTSGQRFVCLCVCVVVCNDAILP